MPAIGHIPVGVILGRNRYLSGAFEPLVNLGGVLLTLGELDEALDYAHLIVGVEQGGEIGTAIQDSWNQMLLGNVSPEDGLAELSASIDKILAG